LDFLDRFSKNIEMSDFVKIGPVGADLFHAGGRTVRHTGRQTGRRTDMTKIIVDFFAIL